MNYTQSRKYFYKTLSINPNSPTAFMGLANLAQVMGDSSEAIEKYHQVSPILLTRLLFVFIVYSRSSDINLSKDFELKP